MVYRCCGCWSDRCGGGGGWMCFCHQYWTAVPLFPFAPLFRSLALRNIASLLEKWVIHTHKRSCTGPYHSRRRRPQNIGACQSSNRLCAGRSTPFYIFVNVREQSRRLGGPSTAMGEARVMLLSVS
eukprot:scaffold2192_cov170-Amphora_coffeaeformis.AAC.7